MKLLEVKELEYSKLKNTFEQRSKQTRAEMRMDPDFKEKVSSASCDLD